MRQFAHPSVLASNDYRPSRRLWLTGIPLLAVAAIAVLDALGTAVPGRFMIVYGSVAVVASLAGLAAGLVSAIVAALFIGYSYTAGLGPLFPQSLLGVAVNFLIGGGLGFIRDRRVALISQLEQTRAALEGYGVRLEAEVARQTERIRQLARQLLAVEERERAHLSRELHDELGQLLTGLKLTLESIRRGSRSDGDWDHALAIVDRVMEDVRTLSLVLRPVDFERMSLGAAIENYVKRQTRHASIRVSLQLGPLPDAVSESVATLMFRCVQEGLTNVLKHAHASRCELSLEHRDGALELCIRDDGSGFELPGEPPPRLGGGLGLVGLQERFELLSGEFRVESERGRGVTLSASVPIRERCRD